MSPRLGPVPAAHLSPGGAEDFVGSLKPTDLIYFLLNVGDGDTQLILMPEHRSVRRLIVVDAADPRKLLALIDTLLGHELVHPDRLRFAVVVATHPHADHIGGMPRLIERWGDRIDEFWHPGYFHPSAVFSKTMTALENCQNRHGLPHVTTPAAGTVRHVDNVGLTVVAPSVQLRNSFGTYGVQVNDASISVMVEYPSNRVVVEYTDGLPHRTTLPRRTATRLLLGADAQHESWAHATVDFPRLDPSRSWVSRELRRTGTFDYLAADVFKVPHHGSKRGLSLELVERVNPLLALVSSVDSSDPSGNVGSHGFPHAVTQEVLREGVQATAGHGADRLPDWELGIFYTADRDEQSQGLGSIAVVVPREGALRLWRFGDSPSADCDFGGGRRWIGPLSRR